jgi:hypothetical protein
MQKTKNFKYMKIMLDNKKQYMYIINKLEMESHLTERKVIENLAFANVQVYKTQVGFNAEVSNDKNNLWELWVS